MKGRPRRLKDRECPLCYRGIVYIGHMAGNEAGEVVERAEAVPCRRCNA
jgi:hypothetical protein